MTVYIDRVTQGLIQSIAEQPASYRATHRQHILVGVKEGIQLWEDVKHKTSSTTEYQYAENALKDLKNRQDILEKLDLENLVEE